MNVTFAMIVFNTDFVLENVIRNVLPFAHKMIVIEGPVRYWQNKGYTTSTDRTNEILEKFPIQVLHGQWEEKTQMCQAFMPFIPPDTHYIWTIDADEVFRPEDIETTIQVLEQQRPRTVGFRSKTFFGDFQHIMGGFERRHSFKRILKYTPGCVYKTHRPPTLDPPGEGWDIPGHEMAEYGVEIYHYSYCFARGVRDKVAYYESDVIKKGDCIPDYFNQVWLPWVTRPDRRMAIERIHHGVHEFQYGVRGDAYTERYNGDHPIALPIDDWYNQIEDANRQRRT